LQIPTAITNVPNPLVQVVWGVTNQGVGEASGNWADAIYISAKQSLDNSAQFVANIWFNASPLEPPKSARKGWMPACILLFRRTS
ncbi:MAG TPA: hypothetical protein VNB54_01750, partial [Alphaproteobacteria bacterium]|nr:hypothetical protein [Alphaproteobacteria bacterium]